MKRKARARKRVPKVQTTQKVFTSVDEVSSFFFPKGRNEKGATKGKERGAKAAENAFTEIAKSAAV